MSTEVKITDVDETHGRRKLPRPIVFWSLNEKTAYRRNRVVQTRLNTIMDDIGTQQASTRKAIRYEAHKFRKKNGKYYSHPCTCVDSTNAVNIAPPNWKPSAEASPEPNKEDDLCSDIENEEGNEFSVDDKSPRKKGIITRAQKPAVKFTKVEEVFQIEDDLQIDDFDGTLIADNKCIKTTARISIKMRSSSAFQSRENFAFHEQKGIRHQSAFLALQDRSAIELETNDVKSNSTYCDRAQSADLCGQNIKRFAQELKSDNFFDKSKAAYQLRQDLRHRAKIRKQGVKPFVFTLQDALNLEKEKFLQSKDKIKDYIKRIEQIKKAEKKTNFNQWMQLNI